MIMRTLLNGNAASLSSPPKIKVWDPLVRLFHWSLVALFAFSYFTGDEWKKRISCRLRHHRASRDPHPLGFCRHAACPLFELRL